jgi:hypothetical protein
MKFELSGKKQSWTFFPFIPAFARKAEVTRSTSFNVVGDPDKILIWLLPNIIWEIYLLR